MLDKNETWDFLLENGIASEETLRIVTSINGYSVETMESILYAATAYRSVNQYKEYIS